LQYSLSSASSFLVLVSGSIILANAAIHDDVDNDSYYYSSSNNKIPVAESIAKQVQISALDRDE